MKFRKIMFWAHLVAGVLAGGIILIMSFSGLCLAFESPAVSWAENGVSHVTPANPEDPRLSLDALVARARAEIPGSPPTGLTLHSEPDASLMVAFGREEMLYLNPFTGAILGHGSRLRAIMRQIENWHRWLGVSDAHRASARAVTGASNFIFLLLAVTGLYLWWPRSWKGNALRSSIWFVRGLRGKSRDWNWHNTVGLWCAPWLIVLTLTGVVMSYQWANDLLYKMTGNEPPPLQRERGGGEPNRDRPVGSRHEKSGAQAANLDLMRINVEKQFPHWSVITLRLPQRAGGPATVMVQEANSSPAFYRSQLMLDSVTAEILRLEPFASQNAGRKLRTWARFLHTGEAGGVTGQTIAALASAGAVLLVWTGLAMAWRRFFVTLSAAIEFK